MSESQINLSKPPRSPPMNIPPKQRSVYNSFFPEPSMSANVVTKLDIIRNNKIKFTELKDELDIYKKELIIFKNLKRGEKLGKEVISQNIEEKEKKEREEQQEQQEEQQEKPSESEHIKQEIKTYYKQEPYRGMWLTRWWYSESREKTIEYLDEDFTKFMNYLDRIINNLNCDPTGIYVQLVKDIREFINDIIPGLYNLKQTYPNTVKVVAKVDSIILTLLDFKEKTDDYLARKNQNVRLTVKSRPVSIEPIGAKYNDMPSNSV
tara:strand:- start:520 stop:1311 length:792 start_codon:yes stop_codon:yes gene_type:complete